MPAITATALTKGEDRASHSIVNTASITPGANRLVLLTCFQRQGTAPVAPTVTGNSLTWVKIASSSTFFFSLCMVSLYRAMGSSPTAGAVTMTFGVAEDLVMWTVSHLDNVDITGTNGSGAIVQSGTTAVDSGSGVPSIALSVFADATNNAAFAGFALIDNAGPATATAGAGMTLLNDYEVVGNDHHIDDEWQLGQNTAPGLTWSPGGSGGYYGGVAVEVKAAPIYVPPPIKQHAVHRM